MGRWHSSGSRGKHETVHRDARQAMAWLDQQAEVKKVILGPYKPGSGRGGRQAGGLVFRNEVAAGVRVFATTGDGLLELTLLVEPSLRPAFLEKLATRWPEHAGRIADPRRRPEFFSGRVLCR
mgnify:CR=1 FL=1